MRGWGRASGDPRASVENTRGERAESGPRINTAEAPRPAIVAYRPVTRQEPDGWRRARTSSLTTTATVSPVSQEGYRGRFASGEAGRNATSLELFLDLAFVFAVAQLTTYLAANLTASGAAKSLLLAWFAWWQWTAFTWAGTAVDLKRNTAARVMVLCLIPAVLLVAVALPRALTDRAVLFAVAYCAVQLWVLAIQAVSVWGDDATRGPFLRYAPFACIAPVTMVVGALVSETARLWVWILAALFFVTSALLAGKADEGEWAVDASHFSERHGLFVIIALGEVLVAIGVNSAALDSLDGLGVVALVATAAVAGALWWSYFAYIPEVFEHALGAARGNDRGTVARDVGSFAHFPLVCGIITYAVVAKHVLSQPGEHLAAADRLLLAGSGFLLLGGFLSIQWRLARGLAPARLAGLLVVAVIALVAGSIAGVVTVALYAATFAVVSIVTARRFASSEVAKALR